MSVCIASFSGRGEGNCARIAREVKRWFADGEATLFDLSEHPLHPCGACHGECLDDRRRCPHIGDVEYPLLEAITNSDLAIFVVPNYCDYPGALYFAFNERSLCYFSGHEELLARYEQVKKRFIVVSGGDRTRYEEIFCQQTNGDTPEILMLSARDYGRNSVAGDLIEEQAAREAIRAFVMGS